MPNRIRLHLSFMFLFYSLFYKKQIFLSLYKYLLRQKSFYFLYQLSQFHLFNLIHFINHSFLYCQINYSFVLNLGWARKFQMFLDYLQLHLFLHFLLSYLMFLLWNIITKILNSTKGYCQFNLWFFLLNLPIH